MAACSQRTFEVMLKFCCNDALEYWSFATKKNVHLTRDKLKGMILIIWKTYRSGLFARGQLKVMIICQNNCRTRASPLQGGALWNNYMVLISICRCNTTIKENPKFQNQQSSTVQSKNQMPRCSLIVHFKILLQAPMNSEQWWFWGRLILSLQFLCHPGPSLPVQVRKDLGQGSIVEEACLQHLRDHSD